MTNALAPVADIERMDVAVSTPRLFFPGSSAIVAHPHAEIVFLVQAVDSIGCPGTPVDAEWVRGRAAYEALDEGARLFGNCQIVKSALAAAYDDYCEIAA